MHPSRPSHEVGRYHTVDYSSLLSGDDHENPALFVKGMQDLFAVWEKTGRIITDKYTIRYLAGMSQDGMYMYIDKRLPKVMVIKGKTFDYRVGFFLHELVELQFSVAVGRIQGSILSAAEEDGNSEHITPFSRINYQVAHQIAEALENRYVADSGIDLPAYTAQCDEWIGMIEPLPLEKSPSSLALYPYEDSRDMATMDEIANTGGPESSIALDRGILPGDNNKPFVE